MRAQAKSRKWIIVIIIILALIAIWYYTGGDLSSIMGKLKSIIPGAGG